MGHFPRQKYEWVVSMHCPDVELGFGVGNICIHEEILESRRVLKANIT